MKIMAQKRPGCLIRALWAVFFVALGNLTFTRAAEDPKPAATNAAAVATTSANPNTVVASTPIAGPDYSGEYVKQSSLLEQLKTLKHDDYERFIQALSVTSSDRLLNSLLEREMEQETKMAGLKATMGPEAPQLKEAAAMISDLKQKIELRANGIMAGLSVQATALRAAANFKNPGKIYIIGSVHVPGPQEMPGDEVLTLSKAIMRAGGFDENADKRNIRVTRTANTPEGKDQIYNVNVADILEKGKNETDLPLEAGDVILVPDRRVKF